MKLVNEEKLRDIIDELAEEDGEREVVQVDNLLSRLKDCTLSPAEILKGDSWVLEELKEYLAEPPTKLTQKLLLPETLAFGELIFNSLIKKIKRLEDQAPISELATEIELMEAKAKAWDETIPPLKKLQKETRTSVEQLKKQVTDFVKRVEEAGRRAEAWKELQDWLGEDAQDESVNRAVYIEVDEKMDELLARSKEKKR